MLIIGCMGAIVERCYIPREGDVVKNSYGKMYNVLGYGQAPGTVLAAEINPDTMEVKYDVPNVELSISDIEIVSLAQTHLEEKINRWLRN